MQSRNTRDRDTNMTPAEFLMQRKIREVLPRSKEHPVDMTWHCLADQREAVLADREAEPSSRRG